MLCKRTQGGRCLQEDVWEGAKRHRQERRSDRRAGGEERGECEALVALSVLCCWICCLATRPPPISLSSPPNSVVVVFLCLGSLACVECCRASDGLSCFAVPHTPLRPPSRLCTRRMLPHPSLRCVRWGEGRVRLCSLGRMGKGEINEVERNGLHGDDDAIGARRSLSLLYFFLLSLLAPLR